MYVEDKFVCHSLWYNNQDDVSISLKTHYVMGLDALSGDIVSAKFPDDDNEFFDANEYFEKN